MVRDFSTCLKETFVFLNIDTFTSYLQPFFWESAITPQGTEAQAALKETEINKQFQYLHNFCWCSLNITQETEHGG
jgi:hypothetical protein